MDYSDHDGVSAGFFVAALNALERHNRAPAGHERMCGNGVEELTYHLAKAEAAYKRLPCEPKVKKKWVPPHPGTRL